MLRVLTLLTAVLFVTSTFAEVDTVLLQEARMGLWYEGVEVAQVQTENVQFLLGEHAEVIEKAQLPEELTIPLQNL